MSILAVFQQTLATVLPVFAMVFVGLGLRRVGWIDARFITSASFLVFKGTLPALLFLAIYDADLEATLNPALLAYFALATIVTYALSWAWARWRVAYADRATYVQGAFRANCGIVGLALAAGMYGDYGLSLAGLLLIIVTLTYNPLAVLVLVTYQPGKRADWWSLTQEVLRNPLIMAAVVAIIVVAAGLTLPEWLLQSGHYFASMTLPLALICIGGTLSFAALRRAGSTMLGASILKMLLLPAIATWGAWLLGFSGRELGVLFVFFASPSATSSFIMAKAMGGNEQLAANIVAFTTLLAAFTMTLGVVILRAAGAIA